MIRFTLNNKPVEVDAESDTPLLWVVREHFDMKGTKYGCGMGLCGACTVHINGKAARSCAVAISDVAGSSVTTIEGLSPNGAHGVQQAWEEASVPQCGYCQPGQIMQAASLLANNPTPTDKDIDEAMAGNICRCGTYPRIRAAIKIAAAKLSK